MTVALLQGRTYFEMVLLQLLKQHTVTVVAADQLAECRNARIPGSERFEDQAVP